MDKIKAQITEGIVSVVVNALLFIVKFIIGFLSNSIALMADAWHTMSDSLTSIYVIFSSKLSERAADKEHPFGHGRWEQISSIFIAFVLGIIAFNFLKDSIDCFFGEGVSDAKFGTAAIVITVISILIKESLAQYSFYLARKTDNVILIAEGWHHRSDSLSSIVVLIGIIIAKFNTELWWMDSVLGLFCALAIFYAAYQIMKESITKLLGEAPSQELIDDIKSDISKLYGSSLDAHGFNIHNYITQKELTFHIKLNKFMTLEDSHKITIYVEDLIKSKYKISATIHVEPIHEEFEH